jgi:hypothetical protein
MPLTHLILWPLALALAMILFGWLLEHPWLRVPSPSPRPDDRRWPRGGWSWDEVPGRGRDDGRRREGWPDARPAVVRDRAEVSLSGR